MSVSPTSACPTKRCTESTFCKWYLHYRPGYPTVYDSFPVVCSPRVRLLGTFVILLTHTTSSEHSSESAPRFLLFLFLLFVEGFVKLMFVVPSCLTFKNRASYIQDGRTATFQMLHFIYFFQQLQVLSILNMLHTLRFSLQNAIYFLMLLFWFLYYSHFTYRMC